MAQLCPGISGDKKLIAECSPEGFVGQIFMRELLGTFILVSVILTIKKYSPSKDTIVNCGAIALTIYGLIKMNGAMSGGCLNPAVAIAQSFFQTMVFADLTLKSMWIYIVACSLGGNLAAMMIWIKMFDQFELKEGKESNAEYDAESQPMLKATTKQ